MNLNNTDLKNEELIKKLQIFQKYGIPHPLTCSNVKECLGKDRRLVPKESNGNVILECPHCKHIQNWVPDFVMDLDVEYVKNKMEEKGFKFD